MAVDSHDDSSHDWQHRTGEDEEEEEEEEKKKRNQLECRGRNYLLLPDCLKVEQYDDHSRQYERTYGEELNGQGNGLHRAYPGMGQACKSGPEIRFINPAIYAESYDTEGENDGVEVRIKVAGQSCDADRRPIVESESLSRLSIDPIPAEYAADRRKNSDTYRRSSFSTANSGYTEEASTVRSASGPVSGKSSARVERWCRIDRTANGNPSDDRWSGGKAFGQPEVHRYVFNGHRVVQMSSTSASASSTSISDFGKVNGLTLARKLAHEEWLRDKRSYVQRKREEQKQENRKKLQEVDRFEREQEERERKERDSFLKWTERKRKEEAEKKAALEKELELQRRLKEIEDNASIAKTICLRQWVRKKAEEQKAQQKEESAKRKQEVEERGKRLEESVRAYEKWREISKNRPKPATQGLLPHQKAKPSYVNPTPWQGASGDEGDQVRNDHQSYNKKETKANSVKSNRRNIPLHR